MGPVTKWWLVVRISLMVETTAWFCGSFKSTSGQEQNPTHFSVFRSGKEGKALRLGRILFIPSVQRRTKNRERSPVTHLLANVLWCSA